MSKNTLFIRRLCINALLAALYVALDLVAFRAGNFKLTFAGLPVILCAVLYGPVDGATVGLCGAFIGQLLSYGLSATTVLWIIPAGVRGALMGLLFIASGRRVNTLILGAEVFVTSIIVTVINTGVMYADSLVYHYPFAAALPETLFRFGSGLICSVAYVVLVRMTLRPLSRISCGQTNKLKFPERKM